MGWSVGDLSAATSNDGKQYPVDKRYIHVMEGQALGDIIQTLYPSKRSMWPKIMAEIQQLNPDAFYQGKLKQVFPGVRLQLPGAAHMPKPQTSNIRRKIGTVTQTFGQPHAFNQLGERRELFKGDEVYKGDRLVTNSTARVRLQMEDDAKIYLRPNTELGIVDYQYKPKKKGVSFLKLIRGGLRTITGRIGQEFKQNYKMSTPVATIGIRGTDYGLRLCDNDSCYLNDALSQKLNATKLSSGLYVGVLQGSVEVDRRPSNAVLSAGEYYYVASQGMAPTRLIDEPTIVFDPIEIKEVQQGDTQYVASANVDASVTKTEKPAEEKKTMWGWILGAVAVLALAL